MHSSFVAWVSFQFLPPQVVRAAERAAQAGMLHGLRLARDDVSDDDEGVPEGLI